MSPRGLAVEVGERQPAELLVDALAEPVHGPLRDAGHDVGLAPREQRAERRRPRRRSPRIWARAPKSMPDAGDDAGHAPRACRPGWSGPPRCSAATIWSVVMPVSPARPSCLPDDAREDDVGRLAQELGPEDREQHADRRRGTRTTMISRRSGPQLAAGGARTTARSLDRLGGRHHHRHVRRPEPGRSPVADAGHRRRHRAAAGAGRGAPAPGRGVGPLMRPPPR